MKLNELAESDPLQYHQFVSEQLKQGEEAKKESNDKESGGSRSFRPETGFCVRTETLAGDGLKIREIESNNGKKGKGKALYVNMCSSKAIEQARDRNGKVLNAESILRSADGMSIPLIVGTPRNISIESSDGKS